VVVTVSEAVEATVVLVTDPESELVVIGTDAEVVNGVVEVVEVEVKGSIGVEIVVGGETVVTVVFHDWGVTGAAVVVCVNMLVMALEKPTQAACMSETSLLTTTGTVIPCINVHAIEHTAVTIETM